jgi:hypothetical protein
LLPSKISTIGRKSELDDGDVIVGTSVGTAMVNESFGIEAVLLDGLD